MRHTLTCCAWALACMLWAGCDPPQAPPATSPSAVPPPAAAYIGDEACADCHTDLYQSYHQTGMGRSVSLFDPATAPEQFGPAATVTEASTGRRYTAFVRNDTLFQREVAQDADGTSTYERLHHADLVIGSGHATRSYLMNANGFYTEMPLTWYVEQARWDLSPGYEQRNYRFSRPINVECMTCHNGLPTASPYTQNHYTDVPDGITCERCHGPASAHVEARLAGLDLPPEAADPNVVNPARLPRDVQLAVCQQCHLTGITVYRPGEDPTTYRPGHPLQAHRTVYAAEAQLQNPEQFGIASHGLRLAQSACFQATEMTCTTCHNPHVSLQSTSLEVFNQTCRSCHYPEVAPETPAPACTEVQTPMTGDCVQCHMQKSGTSDIPHVTFTDHWIRRTLPAPRDPSSIRRARTQTTPATLVALTDTTQDTPAYAALTQAVAYHHYYETRHRLPAYLPRIKQLARQGLADGADHPEARLALARALMETDSLGTAVEVLRQAVARYPAHTWMRYWLGEALFKTQQLDAAATALRAVVNAQPLLIEGAVKLAQVLQQQAAQQPALAEALREEARAVLQQAVQTNPVHHPEAWNNLGVMHLQAQRLQAAGEALDQALALQPDFAEARVNRGAVYLLQNDLPSAQHQFEQAIAADPTYAPAYGNLGVIYLQQDNRTAARRMFERVVALTPGDARAQAYLNQLSAE